MKAKLIKKSKHFNLISKDDNGEEFVIATSSDYAIKALSGLKNPITDETVQIKKLSIKNCQSIENGYDLNELAKADADLRYNQLGEEELWLTRVTGIEYGFNLALSILGDKKYTEDNMMQMAGYMSGIYKIPNVDGREEAKEYLKTFEIKEWDVEVEMEDMFMRNTDQYVDEVSVGNYSTHSKKPKLDENNCLILKRV